MNKKILLPAFVLMVLAQLYFPARMIFHKERVLISGTEYRFKVAPVDPYDPFRGKYVDLTFEENSTKALDATGWVQGDLVYVSLTTDSAGYAKIHLVSTEVPEGSEEYVKSAVSYIIADTVSTVFIDYPFTRFYMEETKAPEAEEIYNATVVDSNQVAYAIVMVKNGEAVIRDLVLDGVPIRELVEKKRSGSK